MSNNKPYLKHEKSQQNTMNLKQYHENNKNINKIATLQPYLTQIEKKHRTKKSLLSNPKNGNNKHNQSSSRSFRIKQLSTSSLYKLNKHQRSKSKQPSHTTIIPNNKLKIKLTQNRQKKIKSYERSFQSSLSKTIITQNNLHVNLNVNNINDKKVQQNHKSIEINHPTIQQNQQNRTINEIQKKQEKINFFNDHLLRLKSNKDNRENSKKTNQHERLPHSKFRKDKYQSLIPRKKSTFKIQQTNLTKLCTLLSLQIFLAYTDVNIDRKRNQLLKQQQKQIGYNKKTQNMRKNNFRRGKYEALHSSVNEKPEQKNIQENIQPLHSERLYKKQSNLSINQEMDIIAENQMQKFYRQVRNKEIQKSLEKSTEKYFGTDSYRPVKSKNQIQRNNLLQQMFLVYVSSMQNPSLNKISQSTNDKSDNRNKTSFNLTNIADLYAYNFDFSSDNLYHQKNIPQKIYEMEDPSQEQSSFNNLNQSDFENQRKNAEIQYFQKQNPQVNWSDDDNCQIDDI